MTPGLDKNLYELFAAQARATPEAVAVVVSKTMSTTYGELVDQARRVCDFLRGRAIAPEQPVGVLMSRSADLVGTLLGILKSGAAYVPIDPDDPPARQLRILTHSGCRLVLAHATRKDALQSLRGEAGNADLAMVAVEDLPASESDAEAPCAPGGNRLAYILFTSGSTGEPKGVEIQHASVVNLLLAVQGLLGFTSRDCYLAASTVGFDISVAELFLPLITGGRILLRDRTCWLNPGQLAADIRDYGVSVVQTGPSTWAVLLDEIPDFPRVRVVISTAEPIRVDLARRLLACGEEAWNLYGPTETTVWSTAFRMTRDSLAHAQHTALSVSIGQPLANTEICIVDQQGVAVPPGQQGELCIGGWGLARGYLHRPDLTAERFVHLGTPGARFYRTGDLAAWSEHGDLLYFGRRDDEMKIRGHRIDPGEVESHLLTHPAVRQAATTWFELPGGSRSIIAGIVCAPGKEVTAFDLHGWLAARLPAPMIPARYTFLSQLPLSPSGKVDRVALRRDAFAAARVPHPDQRRLTDDELVMAKLWASILQDGVLGPDDHFFTCGGDSLAAVRVLALVESTWGVALPVQALFEHPTLAAFTKRVAQARKALGFSRRCVSWWSRLCRSLTGNLGGESQVSTPSTPQDLLARQRVYLEAWAGKRVTRESLVVTRNERGTRPGLFWCLQGYRELTQLAAHLGSEFPVHGLRSGYLLIDYQDAAELETFAAAYADEIDGLQPAGPLLLGGNCQGGLIMHATALKLQARGREVGLLMLMEQGVVRPFPTRVALIFGRESHLNPYRTPGAEPDRSFTEAYPGGYTVADIPGAHGQFFEAPNVQGLARVVRDLTAPWRRPA